MLKWLRRWLEKPITNQQNFSIELYKRVQRGCPSCNGDPLWMEGPKGSICINVYCGHCGEGYNIAPMVGAAQKIGHDKRYIIPEEKAKS